MAPASHGKYVTISDCLGKKTRFRMKSGVLGGLSDLLRAASDADTRIVAGEARAGVADLQYHFKAVSPRQLLAILAWKLGFVILDKSM